MTKEEVLYQFWSSFGLPAFDESTVPTGEGSPDFPYITYDVVTDDLGTEVSISGSLWYKGYSWVEINRKAQEISERIGRGGIVMKCDGGSVWIKRGDPFAQSMSDPSSDSIRRKYINLTAEYFTSN